MSDLDDAESAARVAGLKLSEALSVLAGTGETAASLGDAAAGLGGEGLAAALSTIKSGAEEAAGVLSTAIAANDAALSQIAACR